MFKQPCRKHQKIDKNCKACQYIGFLAKEKRKKKRSFKSKGLDMHQEHVNTLIKSDDEKIKGTKTKVTDGFVYAIANPAFPGWIKVGSAVNLERRLNSYQTSDPNRRFSIKLAKPVCNRKAAEIEAHNCLRKYKRNNEWFNCGIDQVRNIFNSLEKTY